MIKQHGGSRPVQRNDDGRLKKATRFGKHKLILDCTDGEFEEVKKRWGTRERVEVLLSK